MAFPLVLFAGTNARAAAMAEPLANMTFRDPCVICRGPEGTHDAHPHLRDGLCCEACFEEHVEPARQRIIERANRWAAFR